MAIRGNRVAFGAPGLPPKWSHSNKDGIGTAYSADSRLWFTLWRGAVTEVYAPLIDSPQLRDLGYLLTDGETFFHEVRRHLTSTTERPYSDALAYDVVSTPPGGRYTVHQRILSDPHLPVLLDRTRIDVHDPALAGKLRLYVLAAPHLELGGRENTAEVHQVLGRAVLTARKGATGMAVESTLGFTKASVGYVGSSDGWTDLASNYVLDWEFDQAPNGNVALVGEIPFESGRPFTLALAVAHSVPAAITSLAQSFATPFAEQEERFRAQWTRAAHRTLPLERSTRDGGRLYHASRQVLLAHEDKVYPGAFIASLSIPWGAWKGDEDRGGYHLVWTRDMVHTASALHAIGRTEDALRALIYLATRQEPDGGFPQNFWLNGEAYWRGRQLDEVAFPVLLSRHLHEEVDARLASSHALQIAAGRFLMVNGPATQQERWEEVSGYSPSTLAAVMAALTTIAETLRHHRQSASAEIAQKYVDFLSTHLERWTVTRRGTLVPGEPVHYVRIRPAPIPDLYPNESEPMGDVRLPNLPPGEPAVVPAEQLVDPGFLELVRYGFRRPDDPIVEASVRVVDATLKVETPYGPVWHRYNHDGYGDLGDGRPYDGWGHGRAWPLLTGERGHYELAAGRDATHYLATMERLASATGLLSEQVWDEADRPEHHFYLGRPTEAAMPLCWAHAEYLKLVRSVHDGRPFDRLPSAEARYARANRPPPPVQWWKFQRQPATIPFDATLVVQGEAPFELRWTDDDWRTAHTERSAATVFGLHFVELPALGPPPGAYEFTFYWPEADRWEGRNFRVATEPPRDGAR